MSQPPSWSAQAGYAPPPTMTVRRIFKIFLYFVGVFLAEFGLLGAALSIPGSTNRTGDIAFFVGIAALIASLIYFFRTRFKARCLPWLQYLWWIVGVTIGGILAIALEFAIVPNLNGKSQSVSSAILVGIILFYGIALIVIAHLQPSLRHQVGESVRRILNTTPGKQMIVADLVACLQNEYKYSDAILYQYVGDLDDVEQMAIPGTSTRLCRIKGTQEAIAFPQVYSITTYDLRQNVARALQFLNEENVDIGLFLLSKGFEDTLKAYLVAANTKGILSTIPGNKSPEKLSLAEMVSCVKNNGIITNDAVLSLLRQGRNDRAHGGMPSLAERQVLMKSVPYIAGMYIDYIKLLDDLTHSLHVV